MDLSEETQDRLKTVMEDATLNGCIVRIGSRNAVIPVWLKNGNVEYQCNVRSEDVAQRLAPHLRNGVVRLHGTGKWLRENNGSWVLQQFDISDFDVLDDSPLTEVIGRLRAIEGADWQNSNDILTDILDLRRDRQDGQ
jgi:hypothetical protein